MTTDQPEFRLPLRVYIEDTDAGGIVYYVNYLKFLERARTEFMRDAGFGKDFIFNHRLMFVVRSLQVDYNGPATLDDCLEACAQLQRIRGASLSFRQRICRGDEELLSATVRVACVDRESLKPTPMPKQLRAQLEKRI